MKDIKASVPAKVILFGEHAVVYNESAIAIPVSDVRASAMIDFDNSLSEPLIAVDNWKLRYSFADKDIPQKFQHIVKAINLVRETLNSDFQRSNWRLRISSQIPIARGMGSSAAISVLLFRVLFRLAGKELTQKKLIELSYEMEKFHHGTPSGIDNAVIALEAPIIFQKSKGFKLINTKKFHFVIADTGVGKKTASVVADVAKRYQKNKRSYTEIFKAIGSVTSQGLDALRLGNKPKLGQLMNLNQSLLDELGVSSPELDRLIEIALSKKAPGAKLCGAGKGGCILALANDHDHANELCRTLLKAGAVHGFVTTLK